MLDINLRPIHHFVAGAKWEGVSDRYGTLINPANGQAHAKVNYATKENIAEVANQAQTAFQSWSAKSPMARAAVLFTYRDLILKHMDELAELLSSEHGKTFTDAKGDIRRGLDVVEFACGIPSLLKGDNSSIGANSGIDIRSYKVPLGVVAGISPFNFPAMIPLWMIAVPIACGNTVILKPSEKDPSVPVRLAELFLQAGGPPGVFNVVHGDKEAVDAILENPTIQAVSFVGSTPIAEYVYKTGTAHGKRVQAMGGAKNHAIIMPDADMDTVVDAITGAAYGSAGERCMAISVAVAVGKETADRFIEKMIPKVKNLAIASPMEDKDMGPLVSKDHMAKVKSYVDLGVKEGASLVVDGRDFVFNSDEFSDGYYMGGCLFDHVTADMDIYLEEIFGPVLCVVRVDSYEDALALPSNHQYGNGAAIFTENGRIAQHFATTVNIPMIGVNVPIPVPLSFYSFGGWKRSAFGDHNQYGEDSVHFYTKTRTVTSRWPSSGSEGAEFSIPTFN